MADDAARAERTEPATGCWHCNGTGWDETRYFADQPAEAHPCGYCGGSGLAKPITGEEEEVRTIAMVLLRQYDAQYDASHLTWEHFIPEATQIAAALDLPNRPPTQWAYDRACAALEKHRKRADEAEAERDDARQRLANVTASLDDLKNANDQLHVARDNTARLLEEAREERDAARGRAAEEFIVALRAEADRIERDYANPPRPVGIRYAADFIDGLTRVTTEDRVARGLPIARQYATAEAAPDGDDGNDFDEDDARHVRLADR